MTTIKVDTERMMPSSIRKERILCARSVSSATLIGSRSGTRRLMDAPSCFILREGPSKGFRDLGFRACLGTLARLCYNSNINSGIVYSVGHQPLELSILVRVQVPDPIFSPLAPAHLSSFAACSAENARKSTFQSLFLMLESAR